MTIGAKIVSINISRVLDLLSSSPPDRPPRAHAWSGIHFAGDDRSVYVAIVLRLANFHIELAGVQFHVLVTSDALNIELSRPHSDIKIGNVRHFDRDLEIVSRTIVDSQLALITRNVQFHLDLSVVSVLGIVGDMKFVLLGAPDLNSA